MPTIKTQVIKNSLENKNLSGYDFIAFTSVTGVEAFFEILRASCRDVREIGNAKIAAIGNATNIPITLPPLHHHNLHRSHHRCR